MKQLYAWLALAALCLASEAAQAQYTFSNTNLNPYQQNFDSLGTASRAFINNSTFRGVYATVVFDGTTTERPASLFGDMAANDGSNISAAWYHFGYPDGNDRALGGIASTTVTNGTGYIGVRLKNGTTATTIRNLEILYAMEQWYNSGNDGAAKVKVDYRVSTGAITSLTAGTWTPITALGVDAPSTTTTIAPRDGNSVTNRRVLQTTLSGLNLAPGSEVMIRWSYTFNSTTNGNGLSIDDVVITPETNVYYAKTTGNLDDTKTWWTNPNGGGSQLANFTDNNVTYYVLGTDSKDRISNSGKTWTVSGTNSKIVVGTTASPATLYIDGNKNINGTIDVSNGSTLLNRRSPDDGPIGFSLGSLGVTSTVQYDSKQTVQTIMPASYGNLKLSDTGGKILGGNILVSGNLDLSSSAQLTLGNYSATILRGGSVLNASSGAYVITNGEGSLRQSVQNSGLDVLYPVGPSAGSYTPVLLQQPSSTTARNEDVFSVRVLDNMYAKYNANGGGITAVANQNVKKTWLIEEEVLGSSDVTMTLQWNRNDEMQDTDVPNGVRPFQRTSAYISHYTNGAFDKVAAATAAAGTATNSYKISRAGITSFSPFAVSSRELNPLPVELISFTAKRTGATVAAAWATASEKNNAYFTVERSADGKHFDAVGTVAGVGSSQARHEYTWVDKQPTVAIAYYRLRQTDLDGTVSYSPVVAVAAVAEGSTLGQWAVLPNPGSGRFEVLYTTSGAVPTQGAVYNVLGARVASLTCGTGLPTARFDISTQPAGVYLVRLQTTQGSATIRVVKQ